MSLKDGLIGPTQSNEETCGSLKGEKVGPFVFWSNGGGLYKDGILFLDFWYHRKETLSANQICTFKWLGEVANIEVHMN